MALPKKKNMVEYRWKIKYPDGRPNVSGDWMVGKKATMKDFFLSVCSKPELASSLTKELKETIYLDKRILKDRRNTFVDCCICSDNPFKHDKYKLFTWKVFGRWGFAPERLNAKGEWVRYPTQGWTHKKRDGWTENFNQCTNELLHCNYDLCGNMGTDEYLYMRRPLPAYLRMLPLVGTVERWFDDSEDLDDEK